MDYPAFNPEPLDEVDEEIVVHIDATVYDHGSIWIVEPHSEDARQWLSDNVVDPLPSWFEGYAVEAGYISNLVAGMIEAGGLNVDHG